MRGGRGTVPPMSDELQLPPEPASVRTARQWIVGFADEAGRRDVADTLALLVSELVSNVVLHARTPCRLEATMLDGGGLRIEVHDDSPDPPRTGLPTAHDATSGRGMLLVDKLSDRNGTELVDGGKVVWFELDGVAAAS
jgi:anti-sigma regulatory factor (Ser/Thr protein kinase)